MAKPLLNYCLVTQNLASIIEDSNYDSDRYPDISNISGEVIFTPNIANGKAYQLVDSEGITYTVPVSRIRAEIINGEIKHEHSTGVFLFAAGNGSNPDKITYSVEYRNLRSGDLSFSLSPLKFEAIPGGEVDLTMATPVVGAIPAGTTKGDKGDPFLYSDFTPEQINDLKGPLTLADLTPERLETIKGPKGDRGSGIHSVYVDDSDLVFTVDEYGIVEISRIPLDEAANGIRDEISEDLTASKNAATAAEGYADLSASYKDISLSAAERAEYAATETIQQVEGDFATRNYVDGTKWEKGLLYTNNLDTLLTPGLYSQPNSSWATLDNGYPEQTRGTLTVSSWDTLDPQRVYQVFTATYFNRVWMRERVNGAWAKWTNLLSNSFQINGDLTYQDLNNVLTPGIYKQPLSSRATVARNYPQTTRGILTVHQWGAESQISQTYQATFRGDVYTREHSATGWADWIRIGGDTSGTDGDTSGTDGGSQLNYRRDAMKQASRMRRGGVIGTNGATPVSLSFDHGYVNFRDKVLPHLRRLGLPCTSAFNQGQLGSGENEDISWPQLQEFGLNYGVEFAHHGYSHSDISDASTNVERITNALTSSIELAKTNMPEIVADAFILPGVGGTNYDGFNGGAEPESWWDHPAGRVLMQHFPVVSAKRKGHAVPLIQGEDLSFGSDRLGWDTAEGADALMGHIQSLAGTTMGVKCFMHPSQIDLEGKISESKLVETLEWLAAERDAGRIEVLTVSGFAYADVSSDVRMNIAPNWTSGQSVISLSPMMGYLAGAQVLVETTAEASGTLTISATSDIGGLDSTVTHTATAGDRYRLVFSIPNSAKTITITAPGELRSAQIV